MRHNKLVRDKIVTLIEEAGQACTHRILGDDREYGAALKLKLQEEIKEFWGDPCEEEMGDILEVLDAMMEYCGLDPYSVESAQQFKRGTRGTFKGRIFLESVTG
jgi:predicted house-cleaning noncanonical NTP pyrophosphatase (MazG superfamily)